MILLLNPNSPQQWLSKATRLPNIPQRPKDFCMIAKNCNGNKLKIWSGNSGSLISNTSSTWALSCTDSKQRISIQTCKGLWGGKSSPTCFCWTLKGMMDRKSLMIRRLIRKLRISTETNLRMSMVSNCTLLSRSVSFWTTESPFTT